MTITLCNSHPFTFYLPFHTYLRADQCPIHVPSTCTLGLDPCARHSLFGRTDPYYIDNFYSSCLKRLAATLASPLLCNCTVLPVPLSTGPYLGHWSLRGNIRSFEVNTKDNWSTTVQSWVLDWNFFYITINLSMRSIVINTIFT